MSGNDTDKGTIPDQKAKRGYPGRVFRSAEKREMILLENENKFMKKKQKSYILVARENADFGIENLYRPPGSSIHALSRS